MTAVRQMIPDSITPESFALEIAKHIQGLTIEKPLTAKEAADHLKLTHRTFLDRVRADFYPKDVIHRDKKSGCYYFFASELNAYIKSL
jgi:hypothetical protein